MKRIVLAGLMSLISVCAIAQVNIIPKPVSLKVESQQKGFIINTQTRIVIENDSLRNAAVFFNDYL